MYHFSCIFAHTGGPKVAPGSVSEGLNWIHVRPEGLVSRAEMGMRVCPVRAHPPRGGGDQIWS